MHAGGSRTRASAAAVAAAAAPQAAVEAAEAVEAEEASCKVTEAVVVTWSARTLTENPRDH